MPPCNSFFSGGGYGGFPESRLSRKKEKNIWAKKRLSRSPQKMMKAFIAIKNFHEKLKENFFVFSILGKSGKQRVAN